MNLSTIKISEQFDLFFAKTNCKLAYINNIFYCCFGKIDVNPTPESENLFTDDELSANFWIRLCSIELYTRDCDNYTCYINLKISDYSKIVLQELPDYSNLKSCLESFHLSIYDDGSNRERIIIENVPKIIYMPLFSKGLIDGLNAADSLIKKLKTESMINFPNVIKENYILSSLLNHCSV